MNVNDDSITNFAFTVATQDTSLLNVQQPRIVVPSQALPCANLKQVQKKDRPSLTCKMTQISMLWQHSMYSTPLWPIPAPKNNLFDSLSCCIVRESCTFTPLYQQSHSVGI